MILISKGNACENLHSLSPTAGSALTLRATVLPLVVGRWFLFSRRPGPSSPELVTIFLHLLLVGDLQHPSVDKTSQCRQRALSSEMASVGDLWGREKIGKPKVTDVLTSVKATR